VSIDRLQPLLRGPDLEALPLEELVRLGGQEPARRELQRCAAELWSHSLYWQSMHPHGGGVPGGAVGECIRRRFGTFERFTRAFRDAARAQFGSGWLWLVWRAGTVQIVATHDAATPSSRADAVLLGLDLWEHAYYLDYQNRRAAYVSAFLEDLVNWDFANRMLAQAGAAAIARSPASLPAAAAVAGHAPP
jgi:Fe-Mn family superoxide dismutase